MKQRVVDIGDGSIYVINVPETSSEGELSTQDRVILYLHGKLTECESRVKYIEEGHKGNRLKGLVKLLIGRDVKKLKNE